MTIIVGVLCQDGAVMGADTCMTFMTSAGMPVARDEVDKISIFEDLPGVFMHTGELGQGQGLAEHIRTALRGAMDKGEAISPSAVHAFLSRHLGVLATQQPAISALLHELGRFGQAPPSWQRTFYGLAHDALGGGIVAVPATAGTHGGVCLAAFDGVQAWALDSGQFTALLGSGESVGTPFLSFVKRVLWRRRVPSVDDAVLGVLWTLTHAIDHVAFGVDGTPDIAVLRREAGAWTARRLTEDDLSHHRQLLGEIERAIGAVGATVPVEPPP